MAPSRPPGSRRMPEGSTFYDKVVPALLIVLTLLLLVVLLVAVAGVFGWIHL
jgi:hypothetical protein